MRNSILKLASISVAMSALAMSVPAFAQEEAAGPITITGGAAIVSVAFPSPIRTLRSSLT